MARFSISVKKFQTSACCLITKLANFQRRFHVLPSNVILKLGLITILNFFYFQQNFKFSLCLIENSIDVNKDGRVEFGELIRELYEKQQT